MIQRGYSRECYGKAVKSFKGRRGLGSDIDYLVDEALEQRKGLNVLYMVEFPKEGDDMVVERSGNVQLLLGAPEEVPEP